MINKESTLDVNQIGATAKSKIEIYRVLTTEGGVYLPPAKDINYQFLRSIITGEKKHLKGDKISCITVPHFEGLSMPRIFEFAEQICKVSEYLPEVKGKIVFGNRTWFCNIVNTLCGRNFRKFIKDTYDDREEYIIKKKNLKVEATPEFASLFKNSMTVSHDTGRTHFLMKKNRRRRVSEMEDDKVEEYKEKLYESDKAKMELQEEIMILSKQVEDLSRENEIRHGDSNLLEKLYNEGLIDKKGNIQ